MFITISQLFEILLPKLKGILWGNKTEAQKYTLSDRSYALSVCTGCASTGINYNFVWIFAIINVITAIIHSFRIRAN